MDFKYFCWLIIVFLLPKQWRIVGHPTTINYRKEMWNVLQKVSSSIPEQHYISIRDFMLDMDGEINRIKGLCEGHCNEKKQLINETKALERELNDLKIVIPALKLQDYIEEIHNEMFPEWLKNANIIQYYKWVIAINIINHQYFDNLRAEMCKHNYTAEVLATRICEIYDMTSSPFAHKLPVKRPTEQDMEIFCSSFISDDPVTIFTCKKLAEMIPYPDSARVRNGKSTATATEFNIIITNIKTKIPSKFPKLMHQVKDEIQKVADFLKYKSEIILSVQLPGNDFKNTQTERKSGQYYRVRTKINLITGTITELDYSLKTYTALKKAIRDKIIKLLQEDRENPSVLILDDDLVFPPMM